MFARTFWDDFSDVRRTVDQVFDSFYSRRAPNQLTYGKFERTLDLPSGLDVDKLQAHLHEGLLDIRIPIAQAVKPKQIKIAAGAETQKTITA